MEHLDRWPPAPRRVTELWRVLSFPLAAVWSRLRRAAFAHVATPDLHSGSNRKKLAAPSAVCWDGASAAMGGPR